MLLQMITQSIGDRTEIRTHTHQLCAPNYPTFTHGKDLILASK